MCVCVFITAGPITKLFAGGEVVRVLACSIPLLWTLEELFRGNVIIHRVRKAFQVDDCRPRRGSRLRFPWLTPIRNPFELRGLCSRSYL